MKTLIFLVLSMWSTAQAGVAVKVTIVPLPPEFQPLEPAIRSHIIVATQAWASRFRTRPCMIEVLFGLRACPGRGSGRSLVSAPFQDQMHEGKHLSEEGAAQKLRTGHDPNGDAPDIELYFDPAYFRTLWFDPDPRTRTAPMPERSQQKLDAFSVILHELGHAFGFNGFRDPKTGALPGEFLSVYDRWVTCDGTNFFFHGPRATKRYGRPIPLAHTNNNYHHVADRSNTTDPKLTEDLMNGIAFEWSHRYYISPLDVAILGDCGLTPRK